MKFVHAYYIKRFEFFVLSETPVAVFLWLNLHVHHSESDGWLCHKLSAHDWSKCSAQQLSAIGRRSCGATKAFNR